MCQSSLTGGIKVKDINVKIKVFCGTVAVASTYNPKVAGSNNNIGSTLKNRKQTERNRAEKYRLTYLRGKQTILLSQPSALR